MKEKRLKKKIFLIFLFILILILIFLKISKKDNADLNKEVSEDTVYSSNILKDVNYSSKDLKGNEYIINAAQGEIDFANNNIIFLTDVEALIKLKNSNNIIITSNFGKYNSNNFDTIFSKNVIVTYLENKITGEYLDNSFERNSMIMSRNVVYTNEKNILEADIIEMNIDTKDTKIFMYETTEKVNIRSIDWYGSCKKI